MGIEVLSVEDQLRIALQRALKELSRRTPDIPAPTDTHDLDAVKQYLGKISELP